VTRARPRADHESSGSKEQRSKEQRAEEQRAAVGPRDVARGSIGRGRGQVRALAQGYRARRMPCGAGAACRLSRQAKAHALRLGRLLPSRWTIGCECRGRVPASQQTRTSTARPSTWPSKRQGKDTMKDRRGQSVKNRSRACRKTRAAQSKGSAEQDAKSLSLMPPPPRGIDKVDAPHVVRHVLGSFH